MHLSIHRKALKSLTWGTCFLVISSDILLRLLELIIPISQTSSPTSWEQFLRAIWEAVSWNTVLSKFPQKRETHCSYVVWVLLSSGQFWRPQRGPEETSSPHQNLTRIWSLGTSKAPCAGPPLYMSIRIWVSLSWSQFYHLGWQSWVSFSGGWKRYLTSQFRDTEKVPSQETLGKFRLGESIRGWLASFLVLTTLTELVGI